MLERGPPADRDPETLLEFGVVNLDKPAGPSAHQVAAWVRDVVGVERAAHAGTLDPKVTGCLPILTGTATRAAQVFDQSRKGYVAVLELHAPVPDDLEETLAAFEGPLYQKPPRKSAVARRLRVRTIHRLEALEIEHRRVLLSIECDSGTYVRKLCHDLGLAIGTGGHMGALRRSRTGTFDDASLATLHDLADGLAFWSEDGDAALLRSVVQPAERALEHLPGLTVAPSAAREIAEGAPVYAPGVVDADPAVAGGPAASVGSSAADDTATDDDSSTAVDPAAGAPTTDDPTMASDLVWCHTPDGAAVCIGTLVGDPGADSGTVVDLERVFV